MKQFKLNHDQRLIMKLNDLTYPSRKSYISRLSTQAISNIVAYVASSTKWNYKSYDYINGDSSNVDLWTNDHLNSTVSYDHTAETLSYDTETLFFTEE